MVAPAIADMQVEASYGRLHLAKHYYAIGLVFVHALLRDLPVPFESIQAGTPARHDKERSTSDNAPEVSE